MSSGDNQKIRASTSLPAFRWRLLWAPLLSVVHRHLPLPSIAIFLFWSQWDFQPVVSRSKPLVDRKANQGRRRCVLARNLQERKTTKLNAIQAVQQCISHIIKYHQIAFQKSTVYRNGSVSEYLNISKLGMQNKTRKLLDLMGLHSCIILSRSLAPKQHICDQLDHGRQRHHREQRDLRSQWCHPSGDQTWLGKSPNKGALKWLKCI